MKDYTPDQWRAILRNAHTALQQDPRNGRARAALLAAIPQVRAADTDLSTQEAQHAADPGWLAAAGLGLADMASAGFGPQIARALDPEAAAVQEAAQTFHKPAYIAGELVGLVGPGFVKTAPLAIERTIAGIRSLAGRAAAKTALNAVKGATYVGAQAAGRTEGNLAARVTAARRAAPYGAVAGGALPWVAGSVGALASRFKGVAGRVAGPLAEAPSAVPNADALLRAQLLKAGVLPENVEAQIARMHAPSAAPPNLEAPAYTRTPRPLPEVQRGIAQKVAAQVEARNQAFNRSYGQPAISGKPELGLLAEPGPYQQAGPAVRVASSRPPDLAIRLENSEMMAQFPTEVLVKRLAKIRGSLKPSQIAAVEEEIARRNLTGLLQ